MLTQLAEERDATGFKAARLAAMVEELRAEKKALLSKVRLPSYATARSWSRQLDHLELCCRHHVADRTDVLEPHCG